MLETKTSEVYRGWPAVFSPEMIEVVSSISDRCSHSEPHSCSRCTCYERAVEKSANVPFLPQTGEILM